MGFGAFVKVAFKCFDFLAWPLFALGYPLCASIQAIETNSSLQTRKLVTYWVLFSLISLFEHSIVKLLEWVPFWSYIKLVIICWLVIPRFDGAFFIYNHLVRPRLSIDLQILNNWFSKQKDSVLKRDDFLAEAQRFVKENGTEALETLLANKPLQSKSEKPYLVDERRAAAEQGEGSKCQEPSVMQKNFRTVEVTEKKEVTAAHQSKCQEPSVMQKDIETVEVTEKKEVTAAKQVNQPEPNLPHIENRTFAPLENKETTAAVEAGWEHPKIPAFKQVQNEWTCAICQVTTQSKTTLNSHLRGKRHRAACVELKSKNQGSQSKAQPASASKKSDLPTEKKCASSHKIGGQEAKRSYPPKEVPEIYASSNGLKCKVTARPKVKKSDVLKEKQEKRVPNNGCDYSTTRTQEKKVQGQQESKWWCKVCNVKCTSEGDMYCHLNGRKHLSQSSGWD